LSFVEFVLAIIINSKDKVPPNEDSSDQDLNYPKAFLFGSGVSLNNVNLRF
jgi:hypothetical protein